MKLAIPAVAGVPAIAPFDASVSPAGSAPPFSDHVMVPAPPVALSVAL